jgi:hypothetical protein
MKKIFFYVLFSLVIFSCKKDNNGTSAGTSVTSISGKIDIWTLGSNKILKVGFYNETSNYSNEFISVDSSSIDNNGNFNLTSLANPSSIYLVPIDSALYRSNTKNRTFNISNKSAKALRSDLNFRIYSNESGEPIGYLYKEYRASSDSNTAGDFYVGYNYVDRDVSITGSRLESEDNYTATVKANLILKAGWNKTVNKVVSRSETSSTQEISINEPAGAKWIYEVNYKK